MEKILIIDPGHGGSDAGAVANGILEKNANLVTALSLKEYVESKGVKVFMTRTTDVFVSLEARVKFANSIAAKYPNASIVFVSVHHNAGGGDRGEYIHSLYRGNGLKLADLIGTEMLTQIGQQKKLYEKVGDDNKDYYYVIRNTSMDAIITEVAFLDNINDVKICDSIPEQKRNGVVIAIGVCKFFGVSTVKPQVKPPIKKPVKPPVKKSVKPDVLYRVFIVESASNGKSKGRWLPWVKNRNDYAGIYKNGIKAIECKLSDGSIKYRVSTVGFDYYAWVKDTTDYAGDKSRNIDRLQINNSKVKYRVHTISGRWLPWVIGMSDYAGIIGQAIDAVEMIHI